MSMPQFGCGGCAASKARVLESQLEKERKQAAQEAFDAFDTNDDGEQKNAFHPGRNTT